MKIKFGINGTSTEKYRFPNMYWMPNMYKHPNQARFIIVSPKSSIKPLARKIISVIRLFFRQMQKHNDKCTFFTGVHNKPVTDVMNTFNKHRKETTISNLDFSTLFSKLSRNKNLMVLKSLNDSCFDGGERKYIRANNYGACWLMVICLGKQQIKNAVAYLLSTVISLLSLRSSARLLVFLWGLIQLFHLSIYSFIFMKVSG